MILQPNNPLNALITDVVRAPHIKREAAAKSITQISQFDGGVGTEWTIINPWGTLANDTDNVRHSHRSMKLTSTDAVQALASRTANYDLSAATHIVLTFYADRVASVALYFSNAAFTAYYSIGITTYTVGWNTVVIPKSAFTVTGAPDWSAIEYSRIRCTSSAGTVLNVTFDDLYGLTNCMTRPALVIGFDDGLVSTYSEGRRAMDKYHWAGTTFVSPKRVGTSGYMTWAQVLALQNLGWDIGNHTYDHTNLDTLTAAEIDANFKACMRDLRLNDIRPAGIIAYPQGITTEEARPVVEQYYSIGRNSWSDRKHQALPLANRTAVQSYNPVNTTPVASLNTAVDEAIAATGLLMISFHDIVTTASTTYQYSIANFESFLATTAGKDIDVTTFTELAMKYGGI